MDIGLIVAIVIVVAGAVYMYVNRNKSSSQEPTVTPAPTPISVPEPDPGLSDARLNSMTKANLAAWAEGRYGVQLDTNKTKAQMIADLRNAVNNRGPNTQLP